MDKIEYLLSQGCVCENCMDYDWCPFSDCGTGALDGVCENYSHYKPMGDDIHKYVYECPVCGSTIATDKRIKRILCVNCKGSKELEDFDADERGNKMYLVERFGERYD